VVIGRIIAFVLLVAFSIQVSSRYFVIADYYANTSTYAKNCINKARPQLHCNGKCQMMKRLQQQEKEEQQNADKKGTEKYSSVLSSRSFFTRIESINIHSSGTCYPSFSSAILQGFRIDIFHPPGCNA